METWKMEIYKFGKIDIWKNGKKEKGKLGQREIWKNENL